jgi:hypothetical protein
LNIPAKNATRAHDQIAAYAYAVVYLTNFVLDDRKSRDQRTEAHCAEPKWRHYFLSYRVVYTHRTLNLADRLVVVLPRRRRSSSRSEIPERHSRFCRRQPVLQVLLYYAWDINLFQLEGGKMRPRPRRRNEGKGGWGTDVLAGARGCSRQRQRDPRAKWVHNMQTILCFPPNSFRSIIKFYFQALSPSFFSLFI